MWNTYYIETNAICLILLSILYNNSKMKSDQMSFSMLILRRMVLADALLCISDMAAALLRGKIFPGNRVLVYLTNMAYVEAIALVTMIWCLYVFHRTGREVKNKYLFFAPFAVMTLLILTTPFTHFLFFVNEQNLYARGPGILTHWLISWGYMLFAGIVAARSLRRADNELERERIRSLLLFLVVPSIGCIIQMALYGVTSTQVGITLSIVLLVMQTQDNQISTDELTGINNRKALHSYIQDLLNRNGRIELSVMMIDINHFKQINDTKGHNVGDQALIDTARALKHVCSMTPERVFLCRYGGDEFVIVSRDADKNRMDELSETLRVEVAAGAIRALRPYELDISAGSAYGLCDNWSDFNHFLRMADEAMYEDKKKRKAIR